MSPLPFPPLSRRRCMARARIAYDSAGYLQDRDPSTAEATCIARLEALGAAYLDAAEHAARKARK